MSAASLLSAEAMYRITKGYKAKIEPRGNPDDPVWRGIVRMQEVRRAAMRRAAETGERYRDPFEDQFRDLYRRRRDRRLAGFLRRLVHLA